MQANKPNIGRNEVVIPYWQSVQKGGDNEGMAVQARQWPGVRLQRRWTEPGQDVYQTVQWESCEVELPGSGLKVKCRFPSTFSDKARKIIADKYLKAAENENGEQDFGVLVHSIVDRITGWGDQHGYYATADDKQTHYDELVYALLHQFFAYNSPVWFNLGIEGIPQQASACFILSVEDTLESISDWYTRETRIFKRGSGSGVDVSRIRSSYEYLSLGGVASGPVSFMKTADTNAGQIKSGGTTRRAAKMVIMRVDHPDILENDDGTPGFIRCKAAEEKRAHDLIEMGYPGMFNVPGNAYDLVYFQNANHSVRLTDEFMRAYERDETVWTRLVKTGWRHREYRAREILREIAQATWFCGDPGVQFDDIINEWNTCPNSFWIWASNPCSEYLSRDDTSCNLASIRLTKFLVWDSDAQEYVFDYKGYLHLIDMAILSMEIIVGGADYPTEEIAFWTRIYRNLGLGHADLGALLMKLGVPYDSDEGRGIAAMLASVLTARSYSMSATIARDCGGPFADYERNSEPMLGIIQRHYELHEEAESLAAGISLKHKLAADLHYAGKIAWLDAITLGEQYGFRNANTTLEAPTGTISFLMDCDTTGIEPCISLVSYKNLVGGGTLKIVNEAVAEALRALGYDDADGQAIVAYVEEHGTVEGCDLLKPEHLPVFDCAFSAISGGRTISWQGHMRMLGALQPFLSMAISKTVNMPETATVEEIEEAYVMAWKLGVKCVAIYRDGCKKSQPLSTKKDDTATVKADDTPEAVAEALGIPQAVVRQRAMRERLPDERQAVTHKFQIAGYEGYITVGLYDDGRPGELFVTMSKEGSTVSGLLDGFATMVSLALQYGVPLEKLVEKFTHTRFEPSGWTANSDIPMAKSVLDYIFRWLDLRFGSKPEVGDSQGDALAAGKPLESVVSQSFDREPKKVPVKSLTGPECLRCSSITQPAGKCFICPNCGETTGCS